jgi:hypothetical protein
MCRAKGRRDLDTKIYDFPQLEPATSHTLAQALAVHELRRDEGRALVRADFVDGQDVGVIQAGGRIRLLLESSKEILVVCNVAGQQLDGNVPPQAQIVGEIHLPHPARAKQRADLIPSEPCTGGERHGPRRRNHRICRPTSRRR